MPRKRRKASPRLTGPRDKIVKQFYFTRLAKSSSNGVPVKPRKGFFNYLYLITNDGSRALSKKSIDSNNAC